MKIKKSHIRKVIQEEIKNLIGEKDIPSGEPAMKLAKLTTLVNDLAEKSKKDPSQYQKEYDQAAKELEALRQKLDLPHPTKGLEESKKLAEDLDREEKNITNVVYLLMNRANSALKDHIDSVGEHEVSVECKEICDIIEQALQAINERVPKEMPQLHENKLNEAFEKTAMALAELVSFMEGHLSDEDIKEGMKVVDELSKAFQQERSSGIQAEPKLIKPGTKMDQLRFVEDKK